MALLLLGLVPEMLAMMVDLEDDPEWSVSDDLDDEDTERYNLRYSHGVKQTWHCSVQFFSVQIGILRNK